MTGRSMFKFFGERGGPDSEHRGTLHWPGTPDGYPFRGSQVPNLQGDEAENLPLAMDYQSRAFKLWEPEHKLAFDQIMDRIVNGWYMLYRRRDEWSTTHDAPVVWLEWVQIYGETPTGKVPGSGYDANDDESPSVFPLAPGRTAQAG